jgi:hypothetical protein
LQRKPHSFQPTLDFVAAVSIKWMFQSAWQSWQ